jgi:hypothetical protein
VLLRDVDGSVPILAHIFRYRTADTLLRFDRNNLILTEMEWKCDEDEEKTCVYAIKSACNFAIRRAVGRAR